MKKSEKLKVQVWIHGLNSQNERRVLLLKTRPGRGEFWQPVTGGVEADEPVDAAALREATEETGLAYVSPVRAIGFEFEFDRGGDRIRESCYELEAPRAAVGNVSAVRLDPHEHVAARWVAPEEALKELKFESNAQSLRLLMKKWKTQFPL